MIAGRGGVMNVFIFTTLGSVAIVSDTVFGIVVTLCCITLGSVTLGVTTFFMIHGVTWA